MEEEVLEKVELGVELELGVERIGERGSPVVVEEPVALDDAV